MHRLPDFSQHALLDFHRERFDEPLTRTGRARLSERADLTLAAPGAGVTRLAQEALQQLKKSPHIKRRLPNAIKAPRSFLTMTLGRCCRAAVILGRAATSRQRGPTWFPRMGSTGNLPVPAGLPARRNDPRRPCRRRTPSSRERMSLASVGSCMCLACVGHRVHVRNRNPAPLWVGTLQIKITSKIMNRQRPR
jgi:hypothetical protein